MSYDNAFKRGQTTLLIIMLIAGAAVGFAASLVVSRYFMGQSFSEPDTMPIPELPEAVEAREAWKAEQKPKTVEVKQRLLLTYRRANRTGKWFAVIREYNKDVAFMVGTGRFEGVNECHTEMKRLFAALGCELDNEDIPMQETDDS